MEIEIKKEEGCKRNLEITVPSERADNVFRELLADYKKGLRIPGFRKGKVPEKIILRRFEGELKQEVLSKLVPQAIEEAIRRERLEPVERPTIEDVHYRKGEPLRIRTSFEVRPAIELKRYTDIVVKLEAEKYRVTDEAIDEQLERLRLRATTFRPVERERAAVGDYVLANVRGEPQIENGAPFRREGVLVAVEEEGIFQGKLIRCKAGEKLEFDITHPDDFADPELAGTTVAYQVDVLELKERILPELDDEFARDLGRFSSLEDLKDRIRKELQEDAKRRRNSDAAEAILREIAGSNPEVDLPLVMVQRQMSVMEHELRKQMRSRGIEPDNIGFDWAVFREKNLPEAQWEVRSGLLLDALAEREGISVSNKDVQEEVTALAASRGVEPKELRREMITLR